MFLYSLFILTFFLIYISFTLKYQNYFKFSLVQFIISYNLYLLVLLSIIPLRIKWLQTIIYAKATIYLCKLCASTCNNLI